MLMAITRGVSPNLGRCELAHLPRVAIDIALARAQHGAYKMALSGLGCRVVSLPAEPDLPDSVFVEDVAVVFDAIAVVTRPGAESRRPETSAIAPELAKYRRVSFIQPPGTLDGGDVLRLGSRVCVGLSERSNESGIEQLRAVVWPYGHTVTAVPVRGCLHLKSAVTEVAPGTVLVNPAWVDAAAFGHARVIEVDPGEAYAANGLLVGSTVVYPASHPRTRQRLKDHGIAVAGVDVSELQKAEGAVTCCALVFAVDPRAD